METLIQSVLDAVPDPMIEISEEGRIGQANAAALSLFGDWIIGRSHDAVLRQPELLGRIEAVQRGEPQGEARFERSESTGVTQFLVRVSALERPNLRGRRQLLHFTDITHLRESEEMRRDFVANVSHELRTPLTAVIGFVETLKGPAQDDPAAQQRFLDIMLDEAKRMNRLVSDLLSLSRVESEERLRPSQEIDLHAVLLSVLAALRPTAEEKGCTLELDSNLSPGEKGARMMGDRDQLTQVFMNLTENALKYGGAGKPVVIELSREQSAGTIKGPALRVDVVDQGEGIDPQHLPRLTERFYRVDTHRSREMGGTGLGLAIVKHIVNRHRGRLQIASTKGKGSRFSVVFPSA